MNENSLLNMTVAMTKHEGVRQLKYMNEKQRNVNGGG